MHSWHLAPLLGTASRPPEGPFSWLWELSPNEGFVLMILILAPLGFWFSARQVAKWTHMLEALAPALGLQREAKWSFAGEHRGWRMTLRIQQHEVGGGKRRTFLTLRVPVEAALPRGFVAAPRKWESFIAPFFDGMLKTGDSRLDDRFFFQCDDAARGQELVDDPAVREALARLGGAAAMGYIHKGEAGIAFTGQTPDEAALHSHAEALIAVATALHAAPRRARAPFAPE